MLSANSLANLILSNPSVIRLSADVSSEQPARSWAQVARTDSFVSNRHGKFSITKDDLQQMLVNFTTVTPRLRPSCR
jgi:hypothetical protein